MKRRLITALAVILMVMPLALAAMADHGEPADNGNCPEPKVNGGSDTVVASGTHLCIKGGQVIVFVTADGEQTLKELLDNRNQNGQLRDVSHYSVVAQETTTTTTEPTTTTSQPTTTTTTVEEVSTTTTVEDTTTTTTKDVTTTTIEDKELMPLPTIVTTTTMAEEATTRDELPFTGPSDFLMPLAAVLAMAGLLTLGYARRLE